jgi:hypothetical protein
MFAATCGKCSASYTIPPEGLQPLSRVEQMICLKEGLDFSQMVKVTCTQCGTASLVTRQKLVPVGAPRDQGVGPVDHLLPFAGQVMEVKYILIQAFDHPGELFNEERRVTLTSWMENFAKNLLAAQSAFRSGRDSSGTGRVPVEKVTAKPI